MTYGESNFKWEELDYCSKEQVKDREQTFLDQYKGEMFNLRRDARRPPDFSAETRSLLSERAKEQHAAGTLGRQTWRGND
jgi:hypothetical protein